jgi:hypothetical protein
MFGQNCINCSSSETPMDTTTHQHPQKGRLGTPDAINQASYMSSEFKNTQEQTASQMADFGGNAQDLFVKLSEALALEPKYQPNLFLPLQSNVSTFPLTRFFVFSTSFSRPTQQTFRNLIS